MRLVKLTSQGKPDFKTLNFNENGLSIIVGTKTQQDSDTLNKKNQNSYNGVGKSLIVEIIHFCLGSSKNKKFEKHLSNWEFNLTVEINNKNYDFLRRVDNQSFIFINNDKYQLKKFNEHMKVCAFEESKSAQEKLSFRALIPRFIRRNTDYIDPRQTSIEASSNDEYGCLARNLYLLGIDTDLAQNKAKLRSEQKKIESFKKNFEDDDFLREFYIGKKDSTIQVKYIEDKIKQLDETLGNFRVADDYYAIEKEADKINNELLLFKNKRVVLENALFNIDKSLKIPTDISRQKILTLYGELVSAFKVETLKQLEDVENFHKNLINNRIARLSKEKLSIKDDIIKIDSRIQELNNKLNCKLSYLSDKRALDQYAGISKERAACFADLEKIKDYQRIIEKGENDLLIIKKAYADESLKTSEYLSDTEHERGKNFSFFSNLVKEVYSKPAGITLSNNTNENTIRYNLNVHIEGDDSDGINAVRIFCYDLAILLLQKNHKIEFLWHDSRLFAPIDFRQRATLFKIAHKYAVEYKKQYIATINQADLDAMRTEFDGEESYQILTKNIILELKDDGAKSKLLGIQIDME